MPPERSRWELPDLGGSMFKRVRKLVAGPMEKVLTKIVKSCPERSRICGREAIGLFVFFVPVVHQKSWGWGGWGWLAATSMTKILYRHAGNGRNTRRNAVNCCTTVYGTKKEAARCCNLHVERVYPVPVRAGVTYRCTGV